MEARLPAPRETIIAVLGLAALAACGAGQRRAGPDAAAAAPISRAADAAMLPVPAGPYVAGSTGAERAQAYADAERSAGDPRARRGHWFEREEERHEATLARAALVDRTLVTNAAYEEFVAATRRPAPFVDEATWRRQGYVQDYARAVRRFVWADGRPPAGRAEHPVLLVTHADAAAYCAWRGRLVGAPRRLPRADELEKAMRGGDGRVYPWGDAWDGARLNWARVGDSEPVGAHPSGAGPYGHLDLAGNAFAWTSTPWPAGPSGTKFTLKGSAWDDHAGVGRGAARHGRPATIHHAIVGFRCAAD